VIGCVLHTWGIYLPANTTINGQEEYLQSHNDSGDKGCQYTESRITMENILREHFFQSELQNIAVKNSNLWKVEKVLRTKGTGQNKQYFVKWLQWPSKFSS
jgi:hypothetical protein